MEVLEKAGISIDTPCGGKVIPAIKAGVALLGRSTKWMKLSSLSLDDEEIRKIKKILINLSLLSEK